MLQSMHEKVQGWLARVLIIVVCLSFALWGIQSYLHGGFGQNSTVATVGSTKISKQEFSRSLSKARRTYESKRGPLNDQMLPQFKRVVLDRMVQKTAIKEGFKALGFSYSDNQIRGIIQKAGAFKEKGAFSSTRFSAYLNGSNQTLEQFAASMGDQLIQMQFQSGVLGSAFATVQETDRFARWVTQRRDYRYILIHPGDLTVSDPSQKQIEAYYKANKSQFVQPEQISIDYIMLTPKAAQAGMKIASKAIRNYYEDNQSSFRAPVKYRLVTLRSKKKGAVSDLAISKSLASGESLTRLAKHHAGKIRWLAYDKMKAAIQGRFKSLLETKKAEKLKVSGHTLWVQILAKREGDFLPLSAVKTRILNQLRSQGVARLLAKKQELLTNVAYIHSKELAPVAKAAGLLVKSSPYFSREGGKGVFADPGLVRVSWSDEVRLNKNNSNVIRLSDGSLVVLRIHNQKPKQSLPLSDVSSKVKLILKQKSKELKASLLSVTLSKLIKEEKPASKLDALLKQYHLHWVYMKDIQRDAKVDIQALHDKAFLTRSKAVASLALSDGASAVVQVGHVKTLKLEALHRLPNYAKLRKGVTVQYARLSMLALLESITSTINIKVDKKALHTK